MPATSLGVLVEPAHCAATNRAPTSAAAPPADHAHDGRGVAGVEEGARGSSPRARRPLRITSLSAGPWALRQHHEHAIAAPPLASSYCQYAPLLVPLFPTLYLFSLPALSTTPYYDESFAYRSPASADELTSVSRYICTQQASSLFVLLNVPSLAYMWLSPLATSIGAGLNASTISLVLFDVFFSLFLITPVRIAETMHDIFVSLFILFYTAHLLLLLPYAKYAAERVLYILAIASLIGLVSTIVTSAAGVDVGATFYIFECLSYTFSFYIGPLINVYLRE